MFRKHLRPLKAGEQVVICVGTEVLTLLHISESAQGHNSTAWSVNITIVSHQRGEWKFHNFLYFGGLGVGFWHYLSGQRGVSLVQKLINGEQGERCCCGGSLRLIKSISKDIHPASCNHSKCYMQILK